MGGRDRDPETLALGQKVAAPWGSPHLGGGWRCHFWGPRGRVCLFEHLPSPRSRGRGHHRPISRVAAWRWVCEVGEGTRGGTRVASTETLTGSPLGGAGGRQVCSCPSVCGQRQTGIGSDSRKHGGMPRMTGTGGGGGACGGRGDCRWGPPRLEEVSVPDGRATCASAGTGGSERTPRGWNGGPVGGGGCQGLGPRLFLSRSQWGTVKVPARVVTGSGF